MPHPLGVRALKNGDLRRKSMCLQFPTLFFTGELNGEIMAVKMVRSEHSTEALREIETMACFSHPNILPLLGIAKSPGT